MIADRGGLLISELEHSGEVEPYERALNAVLNIGAGSVADVRLRLDSDAGTGVKERSRAHPQIQMIGQLANVGAFHGDVIFMSTGCQTADINLGHFATQCCPQADRALILQIDAADVVTQDLARGTRRGLSLRLLYPSGGEGSQNFGIFADIVGKTERSGKIRRRCTALGRVGGRWPLSDSAAANWNNGRQKLADVGQTSSDEVPVERGVL